MTTESLRRKLEGVIWLAPSSSDFLILEDGRFLKVIEGNRIIVYDTSGNVERVLVDSLNAPRDAIIRWIFSPIPVPLISNGKFLCKIISRILKTVFEIECVGNSTYTYNWKKDYWYIDREFFVYLLSGRRVLARVEVDKGGFLSFNGIRIEYSDFEYKVKRFFIETIVENIDDVPENLVKGLENLILGMIFLTIKEKKDYYEY